MRNVRVMDLAGVGRLGIPREEWPAVLGAALVMELCEDDEGRLAVAVPEAQAAGLAAAIEGILEQGVRARGGAARITQAPHGPGLVRIDLELEDAPVAREV